MCTDLFLVLDTVDVQIYCICVHVLQKLCTSTKLQCYCTFIHDMYHHVYLVLVPPVMCVNTKYTSTGTVYRYYVLRYCTSGSAVYLVILLVVHE